METKFRIDFSKLTNSIFLEKSVQKSWIENRKQKKSEPAMTKESAYVWRCRREMIGMEDNARWETQESNNLRPTNRYGRIRLPNKYESENKAMERGTRGKSRD